jgi:nucleotide-binding universal stress UspA family protein
MALLPRGVRAVIAREAGNLERERIAPARRQLEAARTRLAQAGWRVRIDVRAGQPLEELLAAASDTDVLVVGARGVGGVERLLIGSVAEGAVSRASTPVLVVR